MNTALIRRGPTSEGVANVWVARRCHLNERWSQGGFTLLGDAAHALVPALRSGANTTLEDAAELAMYLSTSASVAAALARYLVSDHGTFW